MNRGEGWQPHGAELLPAMEVQEKQQLQTIRETARTHWIEARQIREDILKEIKDLKESLGGGQFNTTNLKPHLDGIEKLMKNLRLASMAVIFYDFEYAIEKDVETSLWTAHVYFNSEYRQILMRIGAQKQVVLKRKVDKSYRDFLKTSQDFYLGYIQRLAGRFWIPELVQAARGLNTEPLGSPQREAPPSSALRAKIINSCYLTLVRLGDLARYRCQASEKPSKASFDIALTYYGLANMLDPNDGASHHQTAVLYQPSGQHLEIIYYFHRSVCVSKPHKLGVGNLARAFKSLLESQPGAKAGTKNVASKNASETLATWFLRLHAYYSLGELFSAQDELEKEVLHRIKMCLKAEGSEKLVLKMLLINIAAYDLALDNIKSSVWTIQRSRSCQFLLQFKIRVALVLIRLLKSALQDNATKTTNKDPESDIENTVEFSSSLQKLLPFARIYIAWIYVSRADLVEYQEFLQPHVTELYGLLAEILTLLLPYALSSEDIVESKYLLLEDTEAVGLKLLSERKLPLFLTAQILPGFTPPKCHKTLKPRREVLNIDLPPRIETVWRIRDIICCGIYLAGSGKSPLAMVKQDGVETWIYPDDGSRQNLDEATIARTLGKLKMGALRSNSDEDEAFASRDSLVNLNAADTRHLAIPTSLHQRPKPAEIAHRRVINDTARHPEKTAQPAHPTVMGQTAGDEVQRTPFDEDFSEDSAMVEMVNKLICDTEDEDDDIRPQSSRIRADPSYDMNSSTANDIFGGFVTSSNAPAPTPVVAPNVSDGKAIRNLPWDAFYSPTLSYDPDTGYTTGRGFDVPRTTRTSLGGGTNPSGFTAHMTSPAGVPFDQFTNPGTFEPKTKLALYDDLANPNAGSTSPFENRHVSIPAQWQTPSNPRALLNADSPDYSTTQRNTALDNLNAALHAQFGTGATKNQQSPGYSYHNDPQHHAPGHRARLSSSSRITDLTNSPDPSELRNIWDRPSQPSIGHRLTGEKDPSTVDASAHVPNYGKGRVSSGMASPVGSGYGLGGRQNPFTLAAQSASTAAAIGPFTRQYPSNYQGQSGSTPSLAFSNPSSLWTGTPAQPIDPPGVVSCNGNYFNGTTPYGRNGDVNNREDPTHFRNKLKDLKGGDSVLAYDRAILESALTENTNTRPRQQ